MDVLAIYPKNAHCLETNISHSTRSLPERLNVPKETSVESVETGRKNGRTDSEEESWKLLKEEICEIELLIHQDSKRIYTQRKASLQISN